MPGLIEFFLFGIAGGIFQQPIGKSKKSALGSKIGLAAIKKLRKPVNDALEKSSRFHPPADIYELADYASEILSLCNSMGEGWLLTAEMVELIRSGCPNVVCTQPFACLPNHVVGKATIKELRRRYPESNIVAVDYDPGASEVNQLNRIKLMISVAKENLRAGKGFIMQSVKPLAMDMDDSKFRPYHGDDAGSGARGGAGAAGGSCSACGAVTDDAVAAVAERLGEGVR